MLLERDGWCQHAARDNWGRRCLGGAISGIGTLIPFSFDDTVRSVDLETLLMTHAPFLIETGVGRWNDEEGRTKDDVTHLLIRLAELADKMSQPLRADDVENQPPTWPHSAPGDRLDPNPFAVHTQLTRGESVRSDREQQTQPHRTTLPVAGTDCDLSSRDVGRVALEAAVA